MTMMMMTMMMMMVMMMMVMMISTRFVGKPEGVSNVFLTYFDYFFGGSIQTWGLRGTRGGIEPPAPRQIEH